MSGLPTLLQLDPTRHSSLPYYLFSRQCTCVNFCIFQIWKIFYRDYILGRLLPEDLKFLTLILLAHSSDLTVGWVTFERLFYKWLIQTWVWFLVTASQGNLPLQTPGLTPPRTLPPNLGVCLMWKTSSRISELWTRAIGLSTGNGGLLLGGCIKSVITNWD